MTEPRIAVATPADAEDWARLREALWPDGIDDHRGEIAAAFAAPDPERLTLLAFVGDEAVALAEAAIRHDYVNGCDTSPVAFGEGLYVAERWRRQGIASALVAHMTDWARSHGCVELASDALIDNHASHALQRALGFFETERVVFFRKTLA